MASALLYDVELGDAAVDETETDVVDGSEDVESGAEVVPSD